MSFRTQLFSSNPLRRLALIAAWAAGLLASGGCGQADRLFTEYGTRRSPMGDWSVNGTTVFGQMIEDAGHSVRTVHRLSPSAARSDVIIWFPTDYDEPSDASEEWFYQWLTEARGRTLIYVGRDFDAGPRYWQEMAKTTADPGLQGVIGQRAVEQRSRVRQQRSVLPDSPYKADWYNYKPGQTRVINTLEGEPEWTEGVVASKLQMELNSRLSPPSYASGLHTDDAEVLLSSEGEPLVWRLPYYDSEVIVVANGSFLLNMQLVNHEHRKLAGSLIDEMGTDQRVAFLEAGSSPEISEKDPEVKIPTGLEYLGTPPISYVLVQLALAAVVFCFARSPIFGVPRSLPRPHYSDFGKHVAALGELLARGGDREYARSQIEYFHENAFSESHGLRRAPAFRPPSSSDQTSSPESP